MDAKQRFAYELAQWRKQVEEHPPAPEQERMFVLGRDPATGELIFLSTLPKGYRAMTIDFVPIDNVDDYLT